MSFYLNEDSDTICPSCTCRDCECNIPESKFYVGGAIENHFTGFDNLESNLVYALDKGYYYVAQLDAKWVKDTIQMKFGKAYSGINNKYTIVIINNAGRPMLITNHDGKYWLTQKAIK